MNDRFTVRDARYVGTVATRRPVPTARASAGPGGTEQIDDLRTAHGHQ